MTLDPKTVDARTPPIAPSFRTTELPSIGVVCDFAEEKWASMDLVADMLLRHLASDHAGEVAAERLRPPMRRRFSKIPFLGSSRQAFNADRLLNRFGDYARFLRHQAQDFDLFHVVDHSYSQLVHELPAERTIVTCHDMDTFRCVIEPDREPRPRWFRKMTQRILDGLLQAAHVICVSRTTEAALLSSGLISPDRVSVIHYGVYPSFSPDPDPLMDAEIERMLQPQPGVPLLLHVGTSIPRKRIDVLLRVYSAIRRKFPEARLIRVGDHFTQAQSKLVDELGIRAGITVLPFLTRERLAAIFRRANLLLQTSDAEGFGLPVIEAMACGCPVLASDIPALREAGGSAAQFCAVGDIESWSESVTTILRGGVDARRQQRRAALAHAAAFTWKEFTRRTVEIYRRVLRVERERTLAP